MGGMGGGVEDFSLWLFLLLVLAERSDFLYLSEVLFFDVVFFFFSLHLNWHIQQQVQKIIIHRTVQEKPTGIHIFGEKFAN